MKRDKFVIVISVLILIVMLIGTTFAYFAASVSGDNEVNATSATFGGGVEVLPLYTSRAIVPMDDSDVMMGYENQCIDRYDFGACYAYTIHVENTGDTFGYVGTINFEIDGIEHLKYLVLDEEEERYTPDTLVDSGNDQSLGNSFELGSGDSKDFILIIWLSNLEGPQNDEDSNGSFNASVTYTSTYGSRIVAAISNNNNNG